MRNIRARRRFKILLILLLAASMVAFFESRIEAFAPQFKGMAENRIEDVFGKAVDISIGRLDGGIVRPFVLRDVKMLGKGGKASSDIVEINSILSSYRIWDFIFPGILSHKPYVAIDFITKNREISGFVILEGRIENASVSGYIKLFDGDRIDVSGTIKNGMANLILKPREGLIKVEGNYAAEGVLILKIIAGHFKIHDFDIAGEVVIRNIVTKNSIDEKKKYFEGEIETKNLILNYKPFFEVKASYSISNEVLEISNLDLGKICFISGRFGLKAPYIVDASAVTDNVNLGQLLSIFNPRYAEYLNGTMNSKWEFKGPLGNLKSKIRLDIKKGEISGMKFDYLSAFLSGDGPLVNIEDSRIMRESGSMVLAGYMDMRRAGKESLFENLKITDGEKAMVWDSWDTAKWQDVREFRMRKNVAGEINVGFTKFVNEEKVDESLRERDEYELSYSLHPNDSLKMSFSSNSNFFGLEHKDKF